jgi:pyruvate dehydrogenase E1 component alpha subunit
MVGDSETYRTKEEVAQWRQRDPIKRLGEHLTANEKVSEGDLEAIHARVKDQIAGAVKFAKDSPYPDAEEVHTDFWI